MKDVTRCDYCEGRVDEGFIPSIFSRGKSFSLLRNYCFEKENDFCSLACLKAYVMRLKK